jgi:hypothetical protein
MWMYTDRLWNVLGNRDLLPVVLSGSLLIEHRGGQDKTKLIG